MLHNHDNEGSLDMINFLLGFSVNWFDGLSDTAYRICFRFCPVCITKYFLQNKADICRWARVSEITSRLLSRNFTINRSVNLVVGQERQLGLINQKYCWVSSSGEIHNQKWANLGFSFNTGMRLAWQMFQNLGGHIKEGRVQKLFCTVTLKHRVLLLINTEDLMSSK